MILKINNFLQIDISLVSVLNVDISMLTEINVKVVGSTLSPEELIDPKSKISGDMPIKKDTKHWYLPMQKHESWLKKWIDNGEVRNKILHSPKEWKDQVIGQCKSWLNAGLRERAMTRDLDWGVKVPVENSEGKVLYVWLDAPIGYISATKKWAKENNRDWKDYCKIPILI